MLKLNLPYPPSINHYWRHVGCRVLVSKGGREYRAAVSELLNRKKIEALEGELVVDISLHPPDHRRRDIDNCLKALLDSMQWGGAYLNDNQIVRLTIERLEPKPKIGSAHVTIQQLPAIVDTVAMRTCLRCNELFESTGPANRICQTCTVINNLLPPKTPIQRGQKFHNGELME